MWASLGSWIMKQIVMTGLSWLAQTLPNIIAKWVIIARDYFARKERAEAQEKQLEKTEEILKVETAPEKRAQAYVDALNSGRDPK